MIILRQKEFARNKGKNANDYLQDAIRRNKTNLDPTNSHQVEVLEALNAGTGKVFEHGVDDGTGTLERLNKRRARVRQLRSNARTKGSNRHYNLRNDSIDEGYNKLANSLAKKREVSNNIVHNIRERERGGARFEMVNGKQVRILPGQKEGHTQQYLDFAEKAHKENPYLLRENYRDKTRALNESRKEEIRERLTKNSRKEVLSRVQKRQEDEMKRAKRNSYKSIVDPLVNKGTIQDRMNNLTSKSRSILSDRRIDRELATEEALNKFKSSKSQQPSFGSTNSSKPKNPINTTLSTPTPTTQTSKMGEGWLKGTWNKLGKGGKAAVIGVPVAAAAIGTGMAIKNKKKKEEDK